MAEVVLKNIYKRYGTVEVVKDFNLKIDDQEMVVFVGPSGCGKSTTLRMIAGLEEISAGEIYIGERLVNDLAPKDRDIAMVFQNYALYPHMNVYDNMAFSLGIRKMPKAEIAKQVKEAAKILQIEHLLDRMPKNLSGGQRQRVAMGRAIVREPKVFLMDEPLSNLDAKLRATMRTEIIQIQERLGVTTVYVTHDQIEAMTMGDRIVVMKDGIIQQVDTPKNLYRSPKNMFVAGFIGNPAMNFIKAIVKLVDGKTMLFGKGFELRVPEGISNTLAGYQNQEVILGIRPEDIRDEPVMIDTFPQSVIKATIEIVENLGAEILLHLDIAGAKLVASVPARNTYHSNDTIDMVVSMNHLHVFDQKSELAIL